MYDPRYDVLYAARPGASASASTDEPLAYLVVAQDPVGRITGFVLLDAQTQLENPVVCGVLPDYGLSRAP